MASSSPLRLFQGKLCQTPRPLVLPRRLRDEFQVIDALTNRHIELMGINHAGERFSRALATCYFAQHTAQLGGTIEKGWIVETTRRVFLSSKHVNTPDAQSRCDGATHMNVEVELDTHGRFFSARSFWRRAGSEAFRASSSASLQRRSISWSTSSWWS